MFHIGYIKKEVTLKWKHKIQINEIQRLIKNLRSTKNISINQGNIKS